MSICYALAIFAALIWAVFGTGAIRGAHLGQIAGGWLEPDATVMAVPLIGQVPWFGLMAGLGIYAVWQCMPTARHSELHGRLRGWVLALVLFNALWLQLLQRDRMGFSLIFALLMLAVLVRIVVMIDRAELCNNMDRWITRASFGLFTGWLGIIVLGEAGAWLAALGVDSTRLMFKGIAALVLLLVSLLLCALTFIRPIGLYINAGALWVVFWITIDRFFWQVSSPLFAAVSSIATLLLCLCLISSLRTRIHRLRHRDENFGK
ncbi:hypothetical protein [Glutamicibacter sp. NPDC087344]|uniref:hypothetical protein n=1 Tax=Glutamicibacter sp. NPDC087344 TaxID=3363994 RepID=UPI0037FD546D